MKCLYCNKVFVQCGSGRPRKYCSPKCQKEADKERKRIEYVGRRESTCIFCGKELPKFKTRFCSRECGIKHYHIQTGRISHSEILTKECAICGETFETWKSRQMCCSDECRKIYKNSRRDKRLKDIVVDKDISVQKLAKRDNNQCQLCGRFVDWNDKHIVNNITVCGNMYPSIDHIIPISSGGLHSWDNVQLAHRVCNSRKNNKVIS